MDAISTGVTLAWVGAVMAWAAVVAAALREVRRLERCRGASSAAAAHTVHHPLLSFVAIAPPAPGALTGLRIPLEALGLAPDSEDDFRHGRVTTLLSADARTRVRLHVDADDMLVLDRPFPWPASGNAGPGLIACVRDAAPDSSPSSR